MRDSISEYQLSDEADSSAGIKILDRFSFNPLSDLSIATSTWVKSFLRVLSGPTISNPQTAKGQTSGMVFKAEVGLCDILE